MENTRNVLPGLIIALATLIYLPVKAQDQKPAFYQLDIKKSKLLWTAPKNKHNGFILFNEGKLNNISAGWPTSGTFNINMNSMRSTSEDTPDGRKKVDDKLRADDFFAVAKYPTATMLVKRIVPEPNGSTFKIYGDLKIKDVTKSIEFTAIMKQNGNALTATASTNISRSNWSISHPPASAAWNILDRLKDNLIANDIPITLNLVFNKKQ